MTQSLTNTKQILTGMHAAQFASLIFGITIFCLGCADISFDTYGLILGFVGIFSGLSLIAIFVFYALMLSQKQFFPEVLQGLSIGGIILCLQSFFIWAGFESELFENYTQVIFELDVQAGKQISSCDNSVCTESSLFDLLLDSITQDYTLEKYGAALTFFALLAQVTILALSFSMVKNSEDNDSSSTGNDTDIYGLDMNDGDDLMSSASYAPMPSSLNVNLR